MCIVAILFSRLILSSIGVIVISSEGSDVADVFEGINNIIPVKIIIPNNKTFVFNFNFYLSACLLY
ncbi:hypothetical protein BG20_I0612 [Candidatus Nitrosarchaeum limnium BG20]|uniref:Uncharacterized protein n=1 Tax=Candidatus Nitrosarchaeum limnium BG20 TaxID=859192 RepID=S2E9J7_9ARCH|nr:hypothetical protein BG20_I0612 [Candidatus Nitrosarchaeum limnium BG20]